MKIRPFLCLGASVLALSVGFAPAAFAADKSFDIPAQPLSKALVLYSQQSDVVVAAAYPLVEGKQAPTVKGDMPADQALKTLLEGSGLVATPGKDGTLVIKRAQVSLRSQSENASANPTQVAQADASAMSRVEQSPAGIEEVIVTAQKRAERLIDVPQSVSVVSADDLVKQGVTQLRDFASSVPGLNFSTAGAGYTQLSLRGVTAGVDVGQTVGIYVDEVPYGSSAAFGASSQHTLDVSLFDIDRVEVLRGPQGTLYGASALGGVIKYITKTPDVESLGGSARVGLAGTRHGGTSYEGAVVVNVPLSPDRAAVRANGFYARDGGYIDNVTLGENNVNRAEIYGARLDALLTPNDNLAVRLTGFLQNINRQGEGTAEYAFSGVPLDGELDQRRQFREPFTQHFRLASGTITYDLDGATLTSVSSYQTMDLTYLQDLSPFYVPLFGGVYSAIGAPTDGGVDKFAQEVRLASQGARTVEWQVGGFYTHETSEFAQSFTLLDAQRRPAPNNLYTNATPSTFKEYALFGDVTWHITDVFDVTGGVRYARNKQTFSQVGSGAFGLSAPEIADAEGVVTYLTNARYHFSTNATGYVRVATGYRPGGPNIVAINPTTGQPIAPRTFESDTLTSYEAGFKTESDDERFAADAAVYYIDWNDMHVSIANGGFSAFGNARGGASVRGAELTLTARPVERLQLIGAFAIQDAQMEQNEPNLGAVKGERLPNVPRFTASLVADYVLWEEGAAPTIGATLRFVDDRMASFNAAPTYRQYSLPDYTTFDVRAGLTLGAVDVQVYARNLFDARGQLSAFNWRGTAMPAISQPRTIGVSVSTRF